MQGSKCIRVTACLIFILLFPVSGLEAKVVSYDLDVATKEVNFSGKEVTAMSLNDSIPGPTLRFTEGDIARIRFHNRMDVPTSVHWHGILLPFRQDGVPYVTNTPIEPGESKTFQFPIKQTGTYWFHSHTGLQEQRGVYGSIVITPKDGERLHADRDEVVVLSDWTDEDPDEILRTLKSGNDFYSLQKGTAQSLLGAARKGALTDVFKRSLKRMPPMDISDVAYDRFLANGQTAMSIPASPGEKVRLRFVNASTATYFYLQFAGGPVQIISADGMEVEPVNVDRFLMAIAETYDLLVTVPEDGAYELRATAQDRSGYTSIFIGRGEKVLAPQVPRPNLYKMRHSMNGKSMQDMKHDMKMKNMHKGMKGTHSMSMTTERPLAPYAKLRSLDPSTLPKENPRREITLSLTGDMERYIWSIDGEVLDSDNAIRIRHGENVRFTLINKTMMHHPMHLHGHFFRVINGQGEHAPLKHTIDVPPLATRVIEFEANEYNDWFFHCHVLYHAKAGMARVVSYEGKTLDADLQDIREKLYIDPWYPWINATIQSHMTDGTAMVANSRNILSATWEVGWNRVTTTEYDVELAYDRYFNRFFTAFIGGNLTDDFNRGIFGVRYLLPFNFESELRIDTNGELRIKLGQSLQLTNRLAVFADAEYDTGSKEEWVAGANYVISKNIGLVGQYHSDFGAGAGIRIRF